MDGFSGLDWVEVLAAGAAGFGFGALYYTVLGKPWMAALGKTEEEIKQNMSKEPFIRAIIGQMVIAVTLSLLTAGLTDLGDILGRALLIWLGVVVTTMTINHGFQGKSRALTLIDGGHWLGVFLVQGCVIGFL